MSLSGPGASRLSPRLLVVSGLPAAGKTQLGRHLSRELGWPLLSRDDFKAVLYARLPELPRPLAGELSFELMAHATRAVLGAGGPALLESHFWTGQVPAVRALAQTCGAHLAPDLAQVFCEAPLDELRRRHASRLARGEQPGIHLPFDHADLPPEACWQPLPLAGPVLRLNTTHPPGGRRPPLSRRGGRPACSPPGPARDSSAVPPFLCSDLPTDKSVGLSGNACIDDRYVDA